MKILSFLDGNLYVLITVYFIRFFKCLINSRVLLIRSPNIPVHHGILEVSFVINARITLNLIQIPHSGATSTPFTVLWRPKQVNIGCCLNMSGAMTGKPQPTSSDLLRNCLQDPIEVHILDFIIPRDIAGFSQ